MGQERESKYLNPIGEIIFEELSPTPFCFNSGIIVIRPFICYGELGFQRDIPFW